MKLQSWRHFTYTYVSQNMFRQRFQIKNVYVHVDHQASLNIYSCKCFLQLAPMWYSVFFQYIKEQLNIFTTVKHQMKESCRMVSWDFFSLRGILWVWRDGGSGVEVLQNKNLQDLVEILNGGAIQVLLVVIKHVPHGRERGGDKVEDTYTWQRGTGWGSHNRATGYM